MIELRVIRLTVIIFSILSIAYSKSIINCENRSDSICMKDEPEKRNASKLTKLNTYLHIITSSFSKNYEPKNYKKEDNDFYKPSWMDMIYFYPQESLSLGDYIDIYEYISCSVVIGYPVPFYGIVSDMLRNFLEVMQNITSQNSKNHPKNQYYFFKETTSLCQRLLNNMQGFDQVFLEYIKKLPACPCLYPIMIPYDDKVWDKKQRRYFHWRDASRNRYRLDIYKPGASYCVKSLMMFGGQNTAGAAAVQHCCYDKAGRLLTRGSGAATPYLISPEISSILQEMIDILSWRKCQNGFSRYHRARPPNNDNHCRENSNNNLRKMQKNKNTIF